MLLAIDIGNSHTVIGLFKNNHPLYNWRINTEHRHTHDELAVVYQGLFAMQGIAAREITAVIIASVVPPVESAYLTFIGKYFNVSPLLVSNQLDCGITVCTDRPEEVGADRIVNAAAAYDQYKKSVIIVDFGTAITFDCVSRKGEYLGGAITPGLAIALEALRQRTAKLPRVDITIAPKNPIGTNTVDAIRSGILYGYGGLIDGLLAQLIKQYTDGIPEVVATGGMANIIAPYTKSITAVDPLLTLKGLYLLYERNK